MNRAELVNYIAENAGVPNAVADRTLKAALEGITASLQKSDPVVIVNFGTFTVKERAARQGHNPATGEKIQINAAKVVGFKAGKALKDAVKKEPEEA